MNTIYCLIILHRYEKSAVHVHAAATPATSTLALALALSLSLEGFNIVSSPPSVFEKAGAFPCDLVIVRPTMATHVMQKGPSVWLLEWAGGLGEVGVQQQKKSTPPGPNFNYSTARVWAHGH